MRTAPVTIDSNTADLLDVAERAIPFLQAIVDARYAGELLDAVLSVRTELENVLLEDARLAVRKVADAWNLSASQGGAAVAPGWPASGGGPLAGRAGQGAIVTDWYDRQGNPIEMMEAAKKFNNRDYQTVQQGKLDDHLVSTVWLGIDHGHDGGPPLIFETMIFCHHEPACKLDQEQWRYSTETQATIGHRRACRLVKRRKWAS